MIKDGKVCVCFLCDSNMEDYLNIYKKASVFSEIYDEHEDMWNGVRKDLCASIEKGEDSIRRFLVTETKTAVPVGYLNLTYSERLKPEIDIAIAKEYRRKGYGYAAAKALLTYIFENEDIQAVVWSAFPSNLASCRIAEKLGGVLTGRKNILKEAMEEAGYTFDGFSEGSRMPEAINYEISRKCYTEPLSD